MYYYVTFNYYRYKIAVEQGIIKLEAFQEYNLPNDLEKLRKDTEDPDILGVHSIILFNIMYKIEKLFTEHNIEFVHAYAYPDGSWFMWIRSWLPEYCLDSLLNTLINRWRLSCTVKIEDGNRKTGGGIHTIEECIDINCKQRGIQVCTIYSLRKHYN